MALVEYEDIRIDLRKATNADAFRREKCMNRLKARFGKGDGVLDDGMFGYIVLFSRIATQGKDAVNVPFSLSSDPQDEDIDRAFDAFMAMDEDFGNQCWTAITSLNKAADPAMSPDGLGDDPDPNSSSAAKKNKNRGADGGQE